jgi:hypothetical protein
LDTNPKAISESNGSVVPGTAFSRRGEGIEEKVDSDIATAGVHNRRHILIGMARDMEP